MTSSPNTDHRQQATAVDAVPPSRRWRRRGILVGALGFGLPLAAGLLALIHFTPFAQTHWHRYFQHWVETAEVILFAVAVVALVFKVWQTLGENWAFRYQVLPPWDRRPVPADEAPGLLAGLSRLPGWVQRSVLGRRVGEALDFVCQRRSAADFDDHLKALREDEADALDGSYSLIRFISWAIPILGFLGTVLGITDAVANATPEQLEKDLSQVTSGLATAFDTTALALVLTMVVMFLSFVIDRLEQNVLSFVDRFVDRELAHRFQRDSSEGGEFLHALRESTRLLLDGTELLVRQQADLWARTLEGLIQQRADEENHRQQRLVEALEAALERTTETHERRLDALERRAVEQSSGLLQQIANLAEAVRDAGREQRESLLQVAEGVAGQARVLGSLQAGEKQLLRLQELLHQNLNTLSAAGTFEQAIHSLTAAVHLLTARVPPEARTPLRPGPSSTAA